MALRNVSRVFSTRKFSSAAPLIDVKVNDKTGVAVATLQRPPVNSLNLELLSELTNVLNGLEKNKSRGLILTSSSNSVFSAGLDITEMYKPDPDRLVHFWTTLQQAWMKLYGTSYPTVAVVNGHAPAGGCLLALCCEYRVMARNFTIGLNETRLGIVAPDWFIASMRNVIGQRESEIALTTGHLFTSDEALKVGLVDELVGNKEEGLEKAGVFLQKFAKIHPVARALTKHRLRNEDIQNLAKNLDTDLQYFVAYVTQDKVQKGLELYLEGLKQKRQQ